MMLIIIFVIPHHIPSPSSSSRSALSAVHSRREEFEQLSRDRRERMYVWIGIARFLSPAVGCYRHLLYNHHHIHHHSPSSSFTTTIVITRSSNNIWSWLPNLPNSGRLPRAEAGLLEVVGKMIIKTIVIEII